MNRLEKEIYKKIVADFQLLKANWNALKTNPPCENKINELINSIDISMSIIHDHEIALKYYRRKK